MRKEYFGRIIIDPDIMLGKPVIKGTRIPVSLIIRLFAEGHSRDEILEYYPDLTNEDIDACLKFVACLSEECQIVYEIAA